MSAVSEASAKREAEGMSMRAMKRAFVTTTCQGERYGQGYNSDKRAKAIGIAIGSKRKPSHGSERLDQQRQDEDDEGPFSRQGGRPLPCGLQVRIGEGEENKDWIAMRDATLNEGRQSR